MSIQLSSVNGEELGNVSNGSFTAVIKLAQCNYPTRVHEWNGHHDGDTWTPEECELIAFALRGWAITLERAASGRGLVVE